MNRNKKLIGIIASVTAIATVAATWAYYSHEAAIDNTMNTGNYSDVLTERFSPDDNWQPGEEADKVVAVTNNGTYDLVVRIAMSETWTDVEGGTPFITIDQTGKLYDATADKADQLDATDGATEGDSSVVYKALDETNWTLGNDGYWYYNTVLTAGSSTEALMTAITLSADTDMGKYENTLNYCISTNATAPAATDTWYTMSLEDYTDDEGVVDATAAMDYLKGTVTLAADEYLYIAHESAVNASAPGYSDAEYVLNISSETVQASADATTGWDLPSTVILSDAE